MIEIKEVKTAKQRKLFVDFPTKLYKGVKQYVHPLRTSELELFNPKKNVSFEDCEAIYFLAYKDGELVGRIAGIIQRLYNQKVNEKRVRFTRFDAINDKDVAKALFDSVEAWARQKGMNIVHGPLGFNDLDREGMLVEGFDEIATFEEAYNFDYYKDLMEYCGYQKDTDWVEFKLTIPKQLDPKINAVADAVMKKYHLKTVEKHSKSAFIRRYQKGIFHLLDEAYGPLYGVVPYTDKVRKQIIDQFRLFISLDFISVIVDENDEIVAFGFGIPSLSEVINKYEGKLNLKSIFPLLKAVKHPTELDLALIAVKPQWQSRGVPALIIREMLSSFIKAGIKTCETNLNLEYNVHIIQLWKHFEHRQHKRRRAWIKYLDQKPEQKVEQEKNTEQK